MPIRISVPKENKIYNITYRGINGKPYTDSAVYNPDKKLWYWDEKEEYEVKITVITWSALPATYDDESFVYGAIIGDIVGSIYEFHNIKTKDFLLWNPKCYFTDDTVMTIAVYDAIASYKKDPSKDLKQALIDSMQITYEFDETCQGTVPQAIVAFLESDSFEDAIRNAISIGGDSDTLAAITGSLAEAYYEVSARMNQKALSYLDSDLKRTILKY